MVKKKFIDKAKAVHYQVVHRSQRDPLLADADASAYVLKAVPPSYNLLKKGKYEAELPDEDEYPHYDERDGEYDNVSDSDFDDDDFDGAEEEVEDEDEEEGEDEGAEQDGEEGKADVKSKPSPSTATKKSKDKASKTPTSADLARDPSLYGIFFEDNDKYDYVQHLKPIGEDPGAVFMEPKGSQKKDKSGGIKFVDDEAFEAHTGRKVTFDMPSGVFASKYEEEIGMLNRPAAPSMLDVGGDVREVLYALDDEEYVDETADDDFFAALDADEIPEHLQKEVLEAEQKARAEAEDDEEDEEEGDWYKHYKKYRKGVDTFESDDDEDDEHDESDAQSQRRSKRSGGARTAETSFSVMSSSTMFRNDKLTLLDDQFDQVLGEYSDDEIGELDAEDPSVRGDNMVSKQRLESIFDEFLDATEVMGHKKRLVTKIDRMGLIDSVRDDLKENAKEAARMYAAGEGYMNPDADDGEIAMPEEKVRDQWDVETVLSTYSNIYNRPKMISERTAGTAKIRLKGRLGMPVVDDSADGGRKASPLATSQKENAGDETDDEDREEPVNKGVARSKEETKEEKKMRKAEVKADKKNRRVEKKATKTAFKDEQKRQGKTFRNVLAQEQSLHIA
ncbi:hypothetical protein BDZ88DRAFT_451884 [Geranomyces variabilis]|nr:hypothetical protein BDZ88DRAFT_451884 [Geranomyces variabilis]KAJ3135294.1 hypothetical protein HDU90_004017 [Geranomyces variabilis]